MIEHHAGGHEGPPMNDMPLPEPTDLQRHREPQDDPLQQARAALAAARAEILRLGTARRQLAAELAATRSVPHPDIEQVDQRIAALLSSNSWRITAPLRVVMRAWRRLFARMPRIRQSAPSALSSLASSAAASELPYARREYASWVARYDRLSASDLDAIARHMRSFRTRPSFSILLPLSNPGLDLLDACIASVQEQLYPHWQLCIAGEFSQETADILERLAAGEPRITLLRGDAGAPPGTASNAAFSMATGDFLVLLDPEDLLAPHALYMIAAELERGPDADLVYSDEDRIDEAEFRFDPHFKSDWNSELMLGMNMVGQLAAYRAAIVRALGGLHPDFEANRDYDLALRVAARSTSSRIRHVPFVLYHRRALAGRKSVAADRLDRATIAARRAVADYLAARGEAGKVGPAGIGPYHRVLRPLPDPLPLVSLLVPTRDAVDLLQCCVAGLLERTDYAALEIVILDNDSADRRTLAYLAEIARDKRVRIEPYHGTFNYSAINNFGVSKAGGEIIGFINNDIDVIEPGWLKEMVSHAVRPNVGAVGAKLLYGTGAVQHGGVILGTGGVAGHAHKRLDDSDSGYFGRLVLTQNLSAVTAACLVMRRACFEEAGGLDERDFPVAFNDVDLCLKLRRIGYDIVWTPFAKLYHLESATRGADLDPAQVERSRREIACMRARWAAELDHDPFYNPNLTLSVEEFGLAFPPRTAKPWAAAAHVALARQERLAGE
jgi:GT2 family glycosyltransferase